ncbi:MAG: hypothetical protein AUJ72_04365 [Candidatus Omnitrophica bacterium CG1_02_46_14]|nr:MAG: hypothetical protein AUJ72_04365 [Candidatus Omnitrophica bacterium CG1_02_46_14]
MRSLFFLLTTCAAIFLISGCTNINMENDSRYKPFEKSDFFDDDNSSRPPVPHTVPRGFLREDEHLYTGKVNGRFVRSFPFPINENVLRRGQQRFIIYCSVCHNQTGTGDGIIVRRGFKTPPSYHDQRLRDIPEGYIFDVITNGFGDMPRFSPELSVEDRWAIIAYIRALQASRKVSLEQLSSDDKKALREA